MGGGEEVSPNTAKQGKGKKPHTQEDKGKTKLRELTPRLKWITYGPHLAKECLNKEGTQCPNQGNGKGGGGMHGFDPIVRSPPSHILG